MNFILHFIAQYATEGIVILGMIIAVLLFANGLALSNKKNRITEALEQKNKKYTYSNNWKDLEETEDEKSIITPDTIRRYENEFNKKCSLHSVLIQIIPIFPLLGILGTVAGLMLELQSNDIAGMMASLDVALETTLLGLIFAIGLKLIEAIFPSRIIYDVEVMLNNYDKKRDLAEIPHNVQNKEC